MGTTDGALWNVTEVPPGGCFRVDAGPDRRDCSLIVDLGFGRVFEVPVYGYVHDVRLPTLFGVVFWRWESRAP